MHIGERTKICPHCFSKNYTDEPAGICCNSGKVVLPRKELPPLDLYNLYIANDADAKYFKTNIISLNNSFAMVSQQMNVPPALNGFGYLPSIVIQGEVHRYIGPARGPVGSEPLFLQTYLYDVNYDARLERRMRYLRSNRQQNNSNETSLLNTIR